MGRIDMESEEEREVGERDRGVEYYLFEIRVR